MRFPTIGQYIESLINYNGLFKTLLDDSQELVCALSYHNMPDYRVGNFGAVFRVAIGGTPWAMKLFIRHRAARASAYNAVQQFLQAHNLVGANSTHLASFRFLEREIYVHDPMDPQARDGDYFPVLLMEWVDGEPLMHHVEQAAIRGDVARLTQLSEQFEQMALWLLDQEFAHGDIKPENIVVRRSNQSLVLIDYDAMYVPEMEGDPVFEIGTPAYQHPERSTMALSKDIDDYSIALVALSLRALALDPSLWHRYHCGDNLILYPEQVLRGTSECYTQIGQLESLALSPLYSMVRSASPAVRNCREALLWKYSPQIVPLKSFREGGLWGFRAEVLASQSQLDIHAVSIGAAYEAVLEFSQGLAAVKTGGKWGYIDTLGRWVIAPVYDTALSFSENMAAVSLNSKHGYIDTNGNVIGRLKYDEALHMKPEGLALVRKGGTYGFVGRDALMKIPARYHFAQSFREGLAVAMVDGKYGYINTRGQWAVQPQYDYARSCCNGELHVEKSGSSVILYV